MIKRKLIKNGGNSFCEAIKNISNDITTNVSLDNTLYVISNTDSISKFYDNTIKQESDENSSEKFDKFEKFLFTEYGKNPGGIIIFSTDINSMTLSDNKFKNWILQKFNTVKNRFSVKSMLDTIRKKNNVYAWTIGKYLSGVYTGNNGKTFDENSISISMIGVSRDQLFKIADEICREFKQESVLVQDNKTNQIYFVECEKDEESKSTEA